MENNTESNTGLETLTFYNAAIVVADIDESIKWYTDALGFRLIDRHAIPTPGGELIMAFLEGAGMKIEMLQNPRGQWIEAMVEDAKTDVAPTVIGSKALVFYVDDVSITTRELEARGVDFLWKERYLAGDRLLCTMILDTDGTRVNIFQKDTVA